MKSEESAEIRNESNLMKKSYRFILLLFVIMVGAGIGYRMFRCEPILSRPLSLPTVTPAEAGLTWRACSQSSLYYNWDEIMSCYGHTVPMLAPAEEALFARRHDFDDLHLQIGDDAYHIASFTGFFPLYRYTLYKNARPIKTLCGAPDAISSNISLQNVNGRAVWEFAAPDVATIIDDGRDYRVLYGLDHAYRPYVLDGKLIFVGEKDGRYFVVYDGQRVGPEYDHIVIAYCCETVLYSVHFGEGHYLFSGERAGKFELVEITAKSRH